MTFFLGANFYQDKYYLMHENNFGTTAQTDKYFQQK